MTCGMYCYFYLTDPNCNSIILLTICEHYINLVIISSGLIIYHHPCVLSGEVMTL